MLIILILLLIGRPTDMALQLRLGLLRGGLGLIVLIIVILLVSGRL